MNQNGLVSGYESFTPEHTGSKRAQTSPQERLLLDSCLSVIGPLCLTDKYGSFYLVSLRCGPQWKSKYYLPGLGTGHMSWEIWNWSV